LGSILLPHGSAAARQSNALAEITFDHLTIEGTPIAGDKDTPVSVLRSERTVWAKRAGAAPSTPDFEPPAAIAFEAATAVSHAIPYVADHRAIQSTHRPPEMATGAFGLRSPPIA
jgi:hypothetical protein